VDDAVREGSRFAQREAERSVLLEEAPTLADDDGVDQQMQLVDQARAQERLDESGAAGRQDVAAGRGFERRDALLELAFDFASG